jgi:D-beta-D-heptose 7-phosphate kinase/D-beta-D-heptose 1-phosphate adenosyltransferase
MCSKLVSTAELSALGASLRARRKRVVFTNGCFDLLHIGHIRFLREARALGDVLVVGVNTDDSVRGLKGESRPFVPEDERIEILAALDSVDYVVLFDEATPLALIEALRPDVACKGGDYDRGTMLPEATAVRDYGGEFRLLGYTPGHSSSQLIAGILMRKRQLVAP